MSEQASPPQQLGASGRAHPRGPRIVVVEDPKRGDFANVLAIGNLAAEHLGAPLEIAPLHLRANFLLPLVKVALAAGRRLPGMRTPSLRRILQRMLFRGDYAGDTQPVAVISTLGRGEAQGAFLGCFLEAPAIHLGTPKRIARDHFAAVIAHPGDPPQGGEIAVAVVPTRVRLSRQTTSQSIGKICLLLGGNARSVMTYDEGFWGRAVGAAVATAAKHGAMLVVITAPRTGAAAEAIIEETLSRNKPDRADLFLYGRGDRRNIVPEIASADAIFVTAESISMVSDAVASGKPVLALHDGQMPASQRVRGFLTHLSEAGLIRFADLSGWNGEALSLGGIKPLRRCWTESLWEELAPVLGWGAPHAESAPPASAKSARKLGYR
jgi:uncharacterized protein